MNFGKSLCVHQQAQDMKQKGNNFYKQEKFEEAVKCYEEAITLSVAEGENDDVVATYYQNLAAVYDALVRSDIFSVMRVHVK